MGLYCDVNLLGESRRTESSFVSAPNPVHNPETQAHAALKLARSVH
jgi:hypothetical protein